VEKASHIVGEGCRYDQFRSRQHDIAIRWGGKKSDKEFMSEILKEVSHV